MLKHEKVYICIARDRGYFFKNPWLSASRNSLLVIMIIG